MRYRNIILIIAVALVTSVALSRQATFAEHARIDRSAAPSYNWLQFDGDPQHSGNNTQETTLSQTNVANLTQLFRVALPAIADGAPAYLGNVTTPSGTRDLLFVTSKAGHIIALDAHTGATVWTKQHGPGACKINNSGGSCYTTSSPAIDPNLLYVYSYGLDGYVHKYQVGDGTEVTTGGWPEVTTLKGFDEKGSSALAIATAANGTPYLYVAQAGYPGDRGDYQGHVTAINLNTGAQNVFNTVCSNQAVHFVEQPAHPDCSAVQSAVWARPGVIYDAATDRIYFATGNGNFVPTSHDWGDTVLAVNPDGTGTGGDPLDSYTPATFQSLQNRDKDLGSTAPAVLPVPPNSTIQHLAVQGGKDGILRLLNLDNLSGKGGPGHTGGEIATVTVPQGGLILPQPAVWVDGGGTTWVFVANYNGISGLKLTVTQGTPGLQPVWQSGTGGSSAVVVNGVLYRAIGGAVVAYNPTTGQQLWQGSIGGIHWESPIVANGILYVTDEGLNLTAFSLPADISTPTVTGSTTATMTPTSSVTATMTPTSSVTITVTPTQSVTPTPTHRKRNTPTPTPTRRHRPTRTPTSTPTP